MARRNSNTAPAEDTSTPVEPTTDETTEAPAAEATTEAAAEVEVDLTEFQSVVESVLAEADTTTGDVAPAGIDAVNKVYREIDGIKGKNQARAWLEAQMKDALVGENKSFTRAKSFVLVKDGLTAAGGSSTPKAPADPTQAFVQRVAALQIASTLVSSEVPEGVAEDWSDKVQALLDELGPQVDAYAAYKASDDEDAEEPEVSPVVRSAFKMSAGRATSGGGSTRAPGAPRRDIVKHMEQVFASLDSGSFLTINEIAKAESTEYGTDRPSAGAVSARLFPKGKDAYKSDTLAAQAEEGKPRGAVKL